MSFLWPARLQKAIVLALILSLAVAGGLWFLLEQRKAPPAPQRAKLVLVAKEVG